MRAIYFARRVARLPGSVAAMLALVGELAAGSVGAVERRIPFEHRGASIATSGVSSGEWRFHHTFSPDSRLLAVISHGQHAVECWALRKDREPFTLTHPLGRWEDVRVSDYQFLGDGCTLAALFLTNGKTGGHHEITLFDLATREKRVSIELGRRVPRGMTFSRDGSMAIVWSDAQAVRPKGNAAKVDQKIVAYDATTGREEKVLDMCAMCSHAAFSPDGKWLATVHASSHAKGQVILWDAATLERRVTLDTHAGLLSLMFSPDGKLLATAANSQERGATSRSGVRLWDVDTAKERAWLSGHLIADRSSARIYPLFAPHGGYFVASCCNMQSRQRLEWALTETQVKLWTAADGRETLLDRYVSTGQPNDHWLRFYALPAFSPDGSMLATPDASAPASVKFWDTEYWQPFQTLSLRSAKERRLPLSSVGRMEFSPDGQWFAAWVLDSSLAAGEVVVLKVPDVVHEPPSKKSAADD